jgi:hypothetical protein
MKDDKTDNITSLSSNMAAMTSHVQVLNGLNKCITESFYGKYLSLNPIVSVVNGSIDIEFCTYTGISTF